MISEYEESIKSKRISPLKKQSLPKRISPELTKKIKKNDLQTKVSKTQGSFEEGDKPHEVVGIFLSEEGELILEIEWKPRDDQVWPSNSLFKASEIRKYDPLFLITFYESKICSEHI